MSLKDELETAISRIETQRRCTVCEALPNLSDEDAQWLLKALASKLGAKPLSIILQKNGVAVGVPSIHSHRSEGH